MRTVICRYCGDFIVKSGTYRTTGRRGHLPASTNCMRAIAVTVFADRSIPYFVVGEASYPRC